MISVLALLALLSPAEAAPSISLNVGGFTYIAPDPPVFGAALVSAGWFLGDNWYVAGGVGGFATYGPFDGGPYAFALGERILTDRLGLDLLVLGAYDIGISETFVGAGPGVTVFLSDRWSVSPSIPYVCGLGSTPCAFSPGGTVNFLIK